MSTTKSHSKFGDNIETCVKYETYVKPETSIKKIPVVESFVTNTDDFPVLTNTQCSINKSHGAWNKKSTLVYAPPDIQTSKTVELIEENDDYKIIILTQS